MGDACRLDVGRVRASRSRRLVALLLLSHPEQMKEVGVVSRTLCILEGSGTRMKKGGLLEGKEAGTGLLDLSARDRSDVVVLEQILIDTE